MRANTHPLTRLFFYSGLSIELESLAKVSLSKTKSGTVSWMTKSHTRQRLRFRIWHLFVIVAIAAGGLWMHTQAGMVDAEIEVQGVQQDIYQGISTKFVHSLDYRFLEPELLAQSMQIVFLREPLNVEKPIEVGTRIRFRYRPKSVFWLEQQNPNSVAVRKLGLAPEDINEIISEVQLPEIDE